MSNRLKEYIKQNKVCSELIFRDWNEYLEVLFDCGGRVNELLWFEYVLIDEQEKSLGGGGYRDTENPEYMWSETMIYDEGLGQKSLSEIREHIERTIKAHKPYNLVPCFFDIEKENSDG